jgi:hypothetical protein
MGMPYFFDRVFDRAILIVRCFISFVLLAQAPASCFSAFGFGLLQSPFAFRLSSFAFRLKGFGPSP